jgi:hypothetical protein
VPYRPHIRPYLYSLGYAALVFIPLHEPGLLAATLLQLTVCGCLLGLLLLFLTYRKEIRELVEAAFSVCVALLLYLLPPSQGERQQSTDRTLPPEPFHSALFQRPPPRFA